MAVRQYNEEGRKVEKSIEFHLEELSCHLLSECNPTQCTHNILTPTVMKMFC